MSRELEPLLVSVLTPIHRRLADHLAEAYESLPQDLPRGWSWEWCLQEDGDKPVGPAGLGLREDGGRGLDPSGLRSQVEGTGTEAPSAAADR